MWTNIRQLVQQVDSSTILNHTTPSTPALISQLKREARELRDMFPSSSRSPRSLLSLLGIASQSQVLKDELRLSSLASAQRDMQNYVNTYDTLFSSMKEAVLSEQTEISDLVHMQAVILESLGTAALTENIKHLTLLFRELNMLAVKGTTGAAPSDVLRLPPYTYVSGMTSNATSVILHVIVPEYEIQMLPVLVSDVNFRCYALQSGFLTSLATCSDTHVDPLALSFAELPKRLHPNTMRLRVDMFQCVRNQIVGQLVKYCAIDDSVRIGFDTPTISNHSDNFQSYQAVNLTLYFGHDSQSQTNVNIENLKNFHIPSSPRHWTDHVLFHPGMALLALLLASLSTLMHIKNYVDQFKLSRRVRLELEEIEGRAE